MSQAPRNAPPSPAGAGLPHGGPVEPPGPVYGGPIPPYEPDGPTHSLAPIGFVRTPVDALSPDPTLPPPDEEPPPSPYDEVPPPPPRRRVASVRSRFLRRIILLLAFPILAALAVPLGMIEGVWRNLCVCCATFGRTWRL